MLTATLATLPANSATFPNFIYAFQAPGQENQAPWWLFWLLLILGLLSVLIWWVVGRGESESVPATGTQAAGSTPSEEAVAEPAPPAEPAAPARDLPAPAAEAALPEPDDLTRIEGIGPKISSVLQEAGIATYAQLAETEVSRLTEILESSGSNFRLAVPDTWPEQASLAANEAWDRLEKLQDELEAGRRTE